MDAVVCTGHGRSEDCCWTGEVRGDASAQNSDYHAGIHQARKSRGGARKDGERFRAGNGEGEVADALSGSGIAFGQVAGAVSDRLRLLCRLGERSDGRAKEYSVLGRYRA